MPILNILWESNAIKLLDSRDRYTRSSILEDFSNAPDRDAIQFDSDKSGFLTPVSNRRYGVIWHLKDGYAIVRAVVPMINASSEDERDLKARVERAIEREAKGVAYKEVGGRGAHSLRRAGADATTHRPRSGGARCR